jgi:GH15 family glucan-1,4-alpha-glucosidase
MTSPPKIQDYAVVGDGRSAALMSCGGSIDWLCWPRFDSPSLFAGLLDPHAGGAWVIAPAETARAERRYLDGTNVLETRFRTETGDVVLTDFMPAVSEDEKRRRQWPEHELIRRVECVRGEAEVHVRFDPRPDYGRAKVTLRDAGPLGLRIEVGPRLITLRSDVPLAPAAGGGAAARVRLAAGESRDFSLTCAADGPAVLPPLGGLVSEKLALTVDWWQAWSGRARYEGPYRDAVVRSALVLKLLSYAPSGAVVAAPTTSLPERVGGELNWDYRYCWLRDAAFTVRALFGLGYAAEAEAFVNWLLHATRLTLPELRVLYDVYGESCGDEAALDHFGGYAGSRPVRVGNAARTQLQLDVYGEVVEAVAHLARHGGWETDRDTQKMLRRLGEYVGRHWRDPDSGIWEPREPRRHYTHSRLMCWVALDRLLELHERGHVRGIPVETFAEDRQRIRQEVEDRGWNADLRSYTQVLGGDTLDASLLHLAVYGFEEPSSERVRQTHRCLRERLSPGPGLLYRYEQSRPAGEGAFAACGFWDADVLARGGGSPAEAHQAFTAALAYANDVGLFAEEIDPATGDALGNFPQAFTHVGLINAALSLAERESGVRSQGSGARAWASPPGRVGR